MRCPTGKSSSNLWFADVVKDTCGDCEYWSKGICFKEEVPRSESAMICSIFRSKQEICATCISFESSDKTDTGYCWLQEFSIKKSSNIGCLYYDRKE